MAAPVGNQNARKARDWADALRWQLEHYEGEGIAKGQALRAIAKSVIENALAGNKDAWQEVGNRLDGKATQPISGDDTEPPIQISQVKRLIVNANAGNTDR